MTDSRDPLPEDFRAPWGPAVSRRHSIITAVLANRTVIAIGAFLAGSLIAAKLEGGRQERVLTLEERLLSAVKDAERSSVFARQTTDIAAAELDRTVEMLRDIRSDLALTQEAVAELEAQVAEARRALASEVPRVAETLLEDAAWSSELISAVRNALETGVSLSWISSGSAAGIHLPQGISSCRVRVRGQEVPFDLPAIARLGEGLAILRGCVGIEADGNEWQTLAILPDWVVPIGPQVIRNYSVQNGGRGPDIFLLQDGSSARWTLQAQLGSDERNPREDCFSFDGILIPIQ